MNRILKLLCLILSFLLAGCAVMPPTEPAAPTVSSEELLYRRLFDLDHKVELALRMDEREIAKLQQDYESYSARGSKSPIYRMADLDVTITAPDGTVESYTIEQVGVRMKGNTSRTDFYNEEEGIFNLIHLKLSFRETFDEEEYYGADALTWDSEESRKLRKDRTFATLEKLDIRWNKCNDGTYIREYYAFEVFRDNGVLAPRTNLASVDWAGLHMGVFTIYEPVDKVFLRRNLPEAMQGGDLYKLGWTSFGADFTKIDSIGVEDEDTGAFFTYDLKTNKKKSDHGALKKMITVLNGGNMTKEKLAQLVDIDNFLRFAAVSYLLGNPDDLRSNYNNCYVYFPPEGGCLFIPIDYDRCLGVTYEWDPTGNAVSADDPFSLYRNADGGIQRNPLYLYSVCAGGYYVEEFAETLQAVSDEKWFTSACFEAVFAQAQALYGDLTAPSKDFQNGSDHQTTMTLGNADGNMTVQNYFSAKLETLKNALKNGNTEVVLPASRVYIRAAFTDWEIWPQYAMEPTDDGKYVITIDGGCFKVYNDDNGGWYGAEVLNETAVNWSTDGDTNIILPAGHYSVLFDPETETITITSD